MRVTKLAVLTAIISGALTGCGGGGSDEESTKVAAATSTSVFAVRSAFDAIATAGLNLNLVGKDNTNRTRIDDRYNDWSGTFSIAKRAPTNEFLSTTPNCAEATILVDMRMVLIRSRDGYRMQEAATFGYDNNYKPVCAFMLDGHYWHWNLSEPLPLSSLVNGNLSGVAFTGEISRTPESTDFDSRLASVVGLEADTANSAYLSFVYKVITDRDVTLPFRMFGETAEFRFRIDPSGKFLGLQYLRTGVVPDPAAGDPPPSIVLTMNSQ